MRANRFYIFNHPEFKNARSELFDEKHGRLSRWRADPRARRLNKAGATLQGARKDARRRRCAFNALDHVK